MNRWSEMTAPLRAREWWGFKFAPVFGVVYATAFMLRVPVLSAWPTLLTIIVGLAPCAAYTSLINDLTDAVDDLAASKPNRLAHKSRAFVASAVIACIVVGVAVALQFRRDLVLVSLYAAPWIAFTLYSVPPIRLKGRGLFGLLADASGAHLFPTLWATTFLYRRTNVPFDLIWLVTIAVWSLSYGARGILWHQLSDLSNDEKIGLSTFARRHKPTRLRAFGNFVIFPTELAALSLMLWSA